MKINFAIFFISINGKMCCLGQMKVRKRVLTSSCNALELKPGSWRKTPTQFVCPRMGVCLLLQSTLLSGPCVLFSSHETNGHTCNRLIAFLTERTVFLLFSSHEYTPINSNVYRSFSGRKFQEYLNEIHWF